MVYRTQSIAFCNYSRIPFSSIEIAAKPYNSPTFETTYFPTAQMEIIAPSFQVLQFPNFLSLYCFDFQFFHFHLLGKIAYRFLYFRFSNPRQVSFFANQRFRNSARRNRNFRVTHRVPFYAPPRELMISMPPCIPHSFFVF